MRSCAQKGELRPELQQGHWAGSWDQISVLETSCNRIFCKSQVLIISQMDYRTAEYVSGSFTSGSSLEGFPTFRQIFLASRLLYYRMVLMEAWMSGNQAVKLKMSYSWFGVCSCNVLHPINPTIIMAHSWQVFIHQYHFGAWRNKKPEQKKSDSISFRACPVSSLALSFWLNESGDQNGTTSWTQIHSAKPSCWCFWKFDDMENLRVKSKHPRAVVCKLTSHLNVCWHTVLPCI